MKGVESSPLQNFMSKVDGTGGADACWLWRGCTDRHGYGKFGHKPSIAHRVAYELMVGAIPEGMSIDHTCHNSDDSCAGGVSCRHRLCVNPAHLEPVTTRDNLRRSRHTMSRVNAAKTHCRRGHPFDEANTYRMKSGSRSCRTCNRQRLAARRATRST